jgi:hypothetical protein
MNRKGIPDAGLAEATDRNAFSDVSDRRIDNAKMPERLFRSGISAYQADSFLKGAEPCSPVIRL